MIMMMLEMLLSIFMDMALKKKKLQMALNRDA